MKLILTVGLPRSGKSTWAKTQKLPVVNPDSVRLAVHGQRFFFEAEDLVWSIVFIMTKSLFLGGAETVIVDATNVTQRRRQQWSNKFPEARIETKYFDTTPEECIRRATADGMSDLIPVIQRMAKELEVP